MRVDVQEPEPRMLPRVRLDGPERYRVIASDRPDDLATREQKLDGRADPPVHPLHVRVHAFRRGDERGIAVRPSARHHVRGSGPRGEVPGTHVGGIVEHGDPRLVRLPRLHVVEVDLAARAQDRRRPLRRSAAVADGCLERHGNEYYRCLLWSVRQTENAAVFRGGRARIESAHGSSSGNSSRTILGRTAVARRSAASCARAPRCSRWTRRPRMSSFFKECSQPVSSVTVTWYPKLVRESARTTLVKCAPASRRWIGWAQRSGQGSAAAFGSSFNCAATSAWQHGTTAT